VGREDETVALAELAGDNALITVTGPGGVGKTRFVVEATVPLGEALGTAPRFVALTDLPEGSDVDAISAALGLVSPEALAVSIGERSGVLVLDNAEHVLEATAEFVTRLLDATETTTVVVTSRQPLAVLGERLLVLDPLPSPHLGDSDPLSSPAVSMFFERATAGGARWERTPEAIDAVAELCRRIDGLPLAIELAASRARSLGPAELLEVVGQRLDLLRSAERDRPERHQSVRAAIEISLELLDDEHREVFCRLGTFTGRFDLSLAHAVAGPDPDDRLRTIDVITALVDRSLVVARPSDDVTRYQLLELVREVAVESLVRSGLWEETAERFVATMAAEADDMFARGLERWSVELLGWVSSRTNDLIAAIERAIELDDGPDRAVRLFLPLFAAVHQSRSSEVRAAGTAIFERWPDEPAPLRAEALAVLASAHAIGTDVEAAERTARAALEDPDVTVPGRVLALRALVLAAITRGDVAAALQHVATARAESEAVAVPPILREMKGYEASLLDRDGRRAEAVALALEVAEESVVADDAITEIWARLVLANIAIRSGDWAEAHEQVFLAQRATAAIDDGWWGGTVLRSRALLSAYEAAEHAETDGWEASKADWRRAVERASAIGDLSELGFALRAAAVVASRAGHREVALDLVSAVPVSREFTVLPELFEEERRALQEASVTDRPPPSGTVVQAVQTALALLADAPAAPAPVPVPPEPGRRPPSGPSTVTEASMAREGEVWALTFDGATVRVKHRKGLLDIAALLARPDEEVHCLELMGGADVGGDAGPALDERARREYQARILDLQADVDEARAANDPGRAERAELELDALVDQLSEAFGLGGRSRATGSSAERARTAVTYRIRAAIKAVGEQQPGLQKHLAASVKTGTWCSYRPERAVRWRLTP
jgi:non-specific serine/threonine protein kinase